MDSASAESRFEDAAWRAVERFPINPTSIELVSQSENVTFRVTVGAGDTDYVLRLHRPGYSSIEELESERAWIRALGDTGVMVPQSVMTLEDGHYALVDIPGTSEQRYVGMTSWIKGKPLRHFLDSCRDGPKRRRLFRRFGEIAATFHNQSSTWQAPENFVRRRLDLDGLLGELPFWGRFWEHPELTKKEQEVMLSTRASARTSLAAYGETPDNFSLIHADFTPDNIVYDGDRLAVIDFDDSAYGWHMYDVASALIECRFGNDFEDLQAAMLDGYQRCRSLSAQDITMLADFQLIRGMAIIGWYHQRPEYAGAAYFDSFKNWVFEECERRGC